MPDLTFGMVCASNFNRSMEAHKLLKEAGLKVESFGVGNHVKLPGNSATSPNVYNFDSITYEDIHKDLTAKDEVLYTRNGLLGMLVRNMKIKRRPQRWQNNRDIAQGCNVVITFEERVMQQLVNDMNSHDDGSNFMLVVNMDVVDRHADSQIAAPHVLLLCRMLEENEEWEDNVDQIMEDFKQKTVREPLYTVVFA